MIDRYLMPGLRECSSAELALIAIAAGLGEELLFRGFVQGALIAYTGDVGALVVASVAFGAAHAVSRGYAVLAACMGAWLGGLWMLTGNLVAPAACHALYDYVALEVFVRAARRRA
jgi:membrane protease YdiL (CAAX protease family)